MNLKEFISVLSKENIKAIRVNYPKEDGSCSCGNFECVSVGKHPIGFWKGDSVRYFGEDRIKSLFSIDKINFGACTGWYHNLNKSLIVIDIDAEEHELLSILPKTLGYRTGKNGFHFWFWTKKFIKNSASAIADKIDVRGNGGFVVIPESNHKNGNKYKFDDLHFGNEIHDMPEWLEDLCINSTKTPKKEFEIITENNVVKIIKHPSCPKTRQNAWSFVSAKELKERMFLNPDFKIPVGLRNTTMFRILCLDRARGAEKEELERQAILIKSKFENKESFPSNELQTIINSVMKYQTFETRYTKVNENHVKYLNKTKQPIEADYLERLNKLDEAFFSSIIPSIEGVSLEFLRSERIKFLQNSGISNPSQYNQDFFGRKLRERGFVKKKTNKCNLWMISIDWTVLSAKLGNMNTPATTQTKEAPTAANNATVTKTVKVKVKEHPNAYLYPGKTTSEFVMAQIKYFASLDAKQKNAMEKGKYVSDSVAVANFLNSVLPNDIIGFGENLRKVVSKTKTNLVLTDDKELFDCDKAKIDKFIKLNRCEILYRDSKPYGIDEFKEVTLTIKDNRK